jgi:flagellar basal body-associated protein FliL
MSDFAYKFSESKKSLRAAQTVAWVFVWVGALGLVGYVGWSLTASNYEYTYLKPSDAPGQLRSDRWSADFWFTFTLPLLFILPISAGFMVDGPHSVTRARVRIVIVSILFVYFVIAMGWFSSYYAEANKAYTGNSHNPANDKRWCCVNRNLDPIFCTNLVNTQCDPPVGQNELHVDNVFLFKFWGLIIMLFLIILDFIFTVFVYMPVRYRYMELLEETISEQQQQQQEQQQQQQEPIVTDPSDVFAYGDDLPRQQQQQRRSKTQPQQQQNVTVNTTPSNAPVRSSLHAHQQRQQHLQRAAAEIKGANSKLGVQPLYTYKQRSK